MNTSSFIFPKLLRPLQGVFGMQQTPAPTTNISSGLPSRKRKIGECTSPNHDSNKRVATASEEDDVVFVSSAQTTPEPDLDYINRPRPGEDWNDNCWRSETVGCLVAGSIDILSLFPKGRTRSYRVHNELLCFYSPYYRNILSARWEDGKARRSFWADTTQSAMALFIKWLYTRDLTDSKGEYNWSDLVDLYIWAHTTSILALERDIMTALYRDHKASAHHWFFSYAVIGKVYRMLPADSPLRGFIISTHIQHWSPDVDDADVKRQRAAEAPPEFLFAVMEGHASIIRDGDTVASFANIDDGAGGDEKRVWCCGDVCQFHEHESEEEQAATCGLLYQRSVEDTFGRKIRDCNNTEVTEDGE